MRLQRITPSEVPLALRSRFHGFRLMAAPRAPAVRRRLATAAHDAVAAHREEPGDKLFGITELCREFGITPRTIRFYEDKALLAPRRINGARIYTRRDRARLALILRSKAIGATLAEIKHYLDLYGAHGEGRVQQLKFVATRTDIAIRELEAKRTGIDSLLAELRVINAGVLRALVQRQEG